jgi:hypothetical protein
MKRILILSFIVVGQFAHGQNDDLQKAPVIDIKVQVKNKKAVAEYCPDNTCEGVRILKGQKEDAEKLLTLYLFSQSGYIYLQKWKTDPKTEESIKAILKQMNLKKCKSPSVVDESNCVLSSKVKNKAIRLYSSRSDEGKEIESNINLKK